MLPITPLWRIASVPLLSSLLWRSGCPTPYIVPFPIFPACAKIPIPNQLPYISFSLFQSLIDNPIVLATIVEHAADRFRTTGYRFESQHATDYISATFLFRLFFILSRWMSVRYIISSPIFLDCARVPNQPPSLSLSLFKSLIVIHCFGDNCEEQHRQVSKHEPLI